MTCIVGIIDKDGITMAADSDSVAGNVVRPRADKKLFHIQPQYGETMMVGFTSSYRMGQLLRFWRPPSKGRSEVETYMFTTFIDALRKHLKEGGWSKVENNTEQGGTFLVAFHHQLFVVHNDFQIEMPGLPYAAVGSGEEVALGSLYSTQDGILSTEARAVLAVEAASRFITTVGGDVDVMRLDVVS